MKRGPKPSPKIEARDRQLYATWRILTDSHSLEEIGKMVPGCGDLTVGRLSQIILREKERERELQRT